MNNNKKLRGLLLALLATVTCGAMVACAEDATSESEPSSVVNPDASVDPGTSVDPDTSVDPGTSVGPDTPEKKSYVVSFVNWDDTVLQTGELEEGTTPAYEGEIPAKAEDDSATYVFAGWDKEISAVTEAVEYKATFTATYKEFSVKFFDGDTVIAGKNDYHYGDAIVAPNAEKVDTAQYDYTFKGWKLEGTEDTALVEVDATVTANKVYVAVYETAVKKYDVEFYNGDEIVYLAEQVPYGEKPEYVGDAPQKLGLGKWEFTGWDKEIEEVNGENLAYSATFNKLYGYSILALDGGTVTETSASYWGNFDNNLGFPAASITDAADYRFTVEDIDFTAYESVTLNLALNYTGMTVSVNDQQIISATANEAFKISVMKDGSVYCGNTLVKGVTMADGVISFDIHRDATAHAYAEVKWGDLEFDTFTPPAPKEYVNVADQIFTPKAGTASVAAATAEADIELGITKITTVSMTDWQFAPFSAVSLVDYSEVKFYVKKGTTGDLYHKSSGNWEDRKYELIADQWAEVVLTRNADNKFDVTVSGATKANEYAPISSLDEMVISGTKVGDAGILYVSNMVGVKMVKNYVSIVDQIITPTGTTTVVDATEPEDIALGISKITFTAHNSWQFAKLGNMDLSEYTEVRFFVKTDMAGGMLCPASSGNYDDRAYDLPANTWVRFTLVKNADGKFNVSVDGATIAKGYEPISNLNEIAICVGDFKSTSYKLYVSSLFTLVTE